MASTRQLDDAEEALEQQLKDIPLEELQRLKSQGHATVARQGHATVARQSGAAARGRGGEPAEDSGPGERRRVNKNRPMEMSSKKPVPRLREVLDAPKQAVRDPRFESLCGEYDDARFKKSYGFLFEDSMPKEVEKLRKAMKKEKSSDRRGELQRRVSELESTLKEESRRRQQERGEAEKKEEQKEMAAAGKQPYFMSRSKRKREELIAKFKELKEKGGLESFLAKRRKKNAAKEHTKVPSRRRATEEAQ